MKPNRVQVRKADRVQALLRELPGWELAGDGKALRRQLKKPTVQAAVAFVAYVAELAEAAPLEGVPVFPVEGLSR